MTRLDQIRALASQGIKLYDAEATVGRKFTASERKAFRKAYTLGLLQRRQKRMHGLSGADRVAASVSRRYDVADIPPVANPMRRRHCERSVLFFIRHYCTACRGGFFKTPIPAQMRGVAHTMQRCIETGTPYHIREFRGGGKSSTVKGVYMWALATGRAHFIEAVAANARKAEATVRDVWSCMSRSPRFAADFPEISAFMAKTGGNPRKAPSVTFRGENVQMQKSSSEFHLPTVEVDGAPTPSSGGMMIGVGFSANIRGEVCGDRRPDLVGFDDLQDREMAANRERVEEAVATIKADFLGGDSHTDISACLMTSTPIFVDDLSERFAADPYWRTETFRLVVKWPTCFDRNSDEGLWQDFARLWRHENTVEKRDPHPACNRFYLEHRAEMDAGAVVLNPAMFRPNEESAIEHAMILYFTRGEAAFDAEYQMEPHREEAVVRITPDVVLSRTVRTLPAGVIPPSSVMVCAATDINPSYALSTAVMSFDSSRTATVVDWWLHPCKIRGDANDTEFERAVYAELVAVAGELRARGFAVAADDFHWGIDASGNQFKAVTDFSFNARSALGFPAVAMLGRTDREFNPRVGTRKYSRIPGVNDTVLAWNKATRREYVFFNKDRYEETAQRAWLSPVGAAGGLSVFGQRDGRVAVNDEFALQVCGEALRSKTVAAQDKFNFVWDEFYRHDLGDAAYMCFALAGFYGLTSGGDYAAPAKATDWKF